MQYTDNYELKCPEGSDFYSVDDFNDNILVIDSLLKGNENEISVNIEAIGAAVSRIADAETDITALQNYDTTLKNLIDSYHQESISSDNQLSNTVTALDARVSLLELIINTEVSGNPFTVTFSNLDGMTVEGVWNEASTRIEF